MLFRDLINGHIAGLLTNQAHAFLACDQLRMQVRNTDTRRSPKDVCESAKPQ